MQIQINLNTLHDGDLLALKSLIDTLAGDKILVDRGTGPLKKFDPAKVEIWSSDEHGEMARQSVNLDDNVGEIALNTIPKSKPAESTEVVVDCGNSLKLKQDVTDDNSWSELDIDPTTEPIYVEAAEPKGTKNAQADVKKSAAEKSKATKAKAKKDAEAAKVDVETNDVSLKDVSVDEALASLDPEPPADKPVDHAAELRKLMVEVVKAHGPKGAKMASQVVNKIAGVKDVTKIPADKFEEVKAGLSAAIATNEKQPAASPPSEDDPPVTLNTEEAPNANDVDF